MLAFQLKPSLTSKLLLLQAVLIVCVLPELVVIWLSEMLRSDSLLLLVGVSDLAYFTLTCN